MSNHHHSRVLIIGSGPAGYTAAIYAARASLQPMLVTGMEPGGQMSITTDVENYPGFADVIQGPWLMDQMRDQAAAVGTKMINDLIVDVDLARRPFRCVGDSGNIYTGDVVIIATGAQARWLGLESEQKFMGFGVSACATCDGFFYRGKEVAVIGGGNTAVEEALYLTNHANKVTLIHRRDELRSEKIMQDRLFANDKIELVWDSVLDEVLGAEDPVSVTGARLRNVKTDGMSDLAIDGVFVAIGHDPATQLFRGKLDMDDEGYILTKADSTETSIPGVFAAGDVQDKIYRQAVTAAGSGCMAALEAEKFVAEHPLEVAAE
ncbi:MAG: thioredoxin-disulfide reductase [Pseudomonadota bacterium]|nr:thioredoxin-disulfide reductase [Pseudomonadota bacterium]